MISDEPSLPSPNCVAATATTAARLVHCTLESRQADIARLLLEAIQGHLMSVGASRLSISSLARNGPVLTATRTFGFEPYEIILEKKVG